MISGIPHTLRLNKKECSTHRRIAFTSFSGREFDSPHLHSQRDRPFGRFSRCAVGEEWRTQTALRPWRIERRSHVASRQASPGRRYLTSRASLVTVADSPTTPERYLTCSVENISVSQKEHIEGKEAEHDLAHLRPIRSRTEERPETFLEH